MSLVSSVYTRGNTVQLDYKPSKKQKLTKYPHCKCAVCNQWRPSKNLSKKKRQVFHRKTHPICNTCRVELDKLGIYTQYIKQWFDENT